MGNTGPFARLNSDGSLDATFENNVYGPSQGPDGWVIEHGPRRPTASAIIAGSFGAGVGRRARASRD
ncbi:MAG: hypothetical protein IPI07_11705 [Flavobacteriales bacterium]|nr:hypothetical protein [Flavobacteriales bacterium]